MANLTEADDTRLALVLGGGGIAGIAWSIGIAVGLADGGVSLASADHVLATSAGSVVGAQLLSGCPLDRLLARQADPAQQRPELAPDGAALRRSFEYMPKLRDVRDPAERHALVTKFLAQPSAASPDARRAVIANRLLSTEWPEKSFGITAHELETGETVVFQRGMEISLVDAVMASCAVPGIWPPVTIAGRLYVDAGVRSADNADLALGARAVLVVSPNGPVWENGASALLDQIARLETSGAATLLVQPDAQSRAEIGSDILDPTVRAASAKAGREQGRREADQVRAFLDRI